ncbi:hypothetical protein C0J52_13547 [Blattella germanica]|nr:hypothetical protein C0J52_13547 [Blattella germanica]
MEVFAINKLSCVNFFVILKLICVCNHRWMEMSNAENKEITRKCLLNIFNIIFVFSEVQCIEYSLFYPRT